MLRSDLGRNSARHRAIPRRAARAFGLLLMLACLSGAQAQNTRLRLGVMLAQSGPFAPAARSVENGFRLALAESGGRLGGREIEWVRGADFQDGEQAAEAVRRLLADKVDVVLGAGHSGVAEAVVRVTRAAGVPHLVPDAGLASLTGALCASNVFRTSFSNWQSGYAMGIELGRRAGVRSVATVAWHHAAGEEFVKGFRDGFLRGAGRVAQEFWVPFPATDFQGPLAAIAALRPGATFAVFAGAGAAKFITDYDRAGLRKTVPLVGSGFLTEGVLGSTGKAAEGIETVLHYGDGLQTPKNKAFSLAYAKAHQNAPDVHAVAGYDSAQLLAAGLRAVEGDASRRGALFAAMRRTPIDSPRGVWRLSASHNPVQDHYLRRAGGTENRVMGIAVRKLDDDPEAVAACAMKPLP